MIDQTKATRRRMLVARLDFNLPLGIHEPKRPGDVGWDLEAMEDTEIPPFQAVDVPVNARVALPDGVWGEIRARSSIARRNLQVDAGTLDNGYRGPLYVLTRYMALPPLESYGNGAVSERHPRQGDAVVIKKGERVGQLVLHAAAPAWLHEVSAEIFPVSTERGEDGFGSTGR